jgi:hypothetical protein
MDRYETEKDASRKVFRLTVKGQNRTVNYVPTSIVAPAPAELNSLWAGLKTIGLSLPHLPAGRDGAQQAMFRTLQRP